MNPPPTYPADMAIRDKISREAAAAELGVSVLTVDRYIKAGRLTRDKNNITRRVWLSRREVEKLRAEREDEQ